jgi:hypothetical protein
MAVDFELRPVRIEAGLDGDATRPAILDLTRRLDLSGGRMFSVREIPGLCYLR